MWPDLIIAVGIFWIGFILHSIYEDLYEIRRALESKKEGQTKNHEY